MINTKSLSYNYFLLFFAILMPIVSPIVLEYFFNSFFVTFSHLLIPCVFLFSYFYLEKKDSQKIVKMKRFSTKYLKDSNNAGLEFLLIPCFWIVFGLISSAVCYSLGLSGA